MQAVFDERTRQVKEHEEPFNVFYADNDIPCCSIYVLISHRMRLNVHEKLKEASKSTVSTSYIESPVKNLEDAAV